MSFWKTWRRGLFCFVFCQGSLLTIVDLVVEPLRRRMRPTEVTEIRILKTLTKNCQISGTLHYLTQMCILSIMSLTDSEWPL
jgi:hypothetical protein